jgi:hypothetical protein
MDALMAIDRPTPKAVQPKLVSYLLVEASATTDPDDTTGVTKVAGTYGLHIPTIRALPAANRYFFVCEASARAPEDDDGMSFKIECTYGAIMQTPERGEEELIGQAKFWARNVIWARFSDHVAHMAGQMRQLVPPLPVSPAKTSADGVVIESGAAIAEMTSQPDSPPTATKTGRRTKRQPK